MAIEKRTITGIAVLLLAALVVLGTAGCISMDTLSGQTIQEKNNISWYNYDIMNDPDFTAVNHTFVAKDNFYAYANVVDILHKTPYALDEENYDEFLEYVMTSGEHHAGSAQSSATQEKLDAMFDTLAQDTSLTGTEAELVRAVYTMYHDNATRNALGITPVLPAVDEIRKVSTLDELSALISTGGKSSLKEAFVREQILGDYIHDGKIKSVYLVPQEFVLINSGNYQNMTDENVNLYLYLLGNFYDFLIKCGYSEDEADNTVIALIQFEGALAAGINANNELLIKAQSDPELNEKIGQEMQKTYDQLSEMAFPIAGDLKVYHDAGAEHFIVDNLPWLDKLNELYTEENIEGFKAAMLYNLFITATPFLDTETQKMYFDRSLLNIYPYLPNSDEQNTLFALEWEIRKANPESRQNALRTYLKSIDLDQYLNDTSSEELNTTMIADLIHEKTGKTAKELLPPRSYNYALNNIKNDYIGMALGKVITDVNVPAGDKEKYTAFVYDIISTFRDRLMNADWMSDATRSAALDKLSKIKVRVFYPDDWSYYSYDDVNYKDAGTFYNLSVQLRKHNQAELVKDALQAPSAGIWFKLINAASPLPQTYNAFYYSLDNSINILYGYMAGILADPSASTEDIYAIVGTTVAHEITHGFDPTGSQFDGDGTLRPWISGDDSAYYNAKVQKIADYYSGFEALPGTHLNGNIETDEIVADYGGLSVILDMARKIDNFDYDKFFTAFAQGMYGPMLEATYHLQLADAHPPGMYRVNGDVQQYDEFYDTYNVTEGDQMYLAPENRLTIW